MSFTTFSGLSNPFFSAPVVSPNTATFGTLSALGQVPLVGISGKFATYSVLNSGVELATGQTASTYTIAGLGNNVQIGPVTLVPYDIDGVAGTPFTVKGGSGGGKIYTWAQANAPTFSAITASGTTLACTGTFSNIYVSYSGGVAGTPASGALINTANSISQVYTGLAGNTTYTFVVYPVNGDGIPGSATGTNKATGSVLTLLATLWVAGGEGTGGNTLAYSTDGINWVGLTKSIFSTRVSGIAYSTFQNRWVAAGSGGNVLAYSFDGINWSGSVTSAFSGALCVAYSAYQNRWVAGGGATAGIGNTLAYSSDGINWISLGNSALSYNARSVVYSENRKIWVAAGGLDANTLAYSTDGINWTGLGKTVFDGQGIGVAYSAFHNRWVAVGSVNVNTMADSTDGITWTGRGKATFNVSGSGVAYSAYQNRWVAAGCGNSGNSLAYSTDGINWAGSGLSIFSTQGTGVAYSAYQNCWVTAGYGTVHTLGYSTTGMTWTGRGKSIFSPYANGVACNQ
jgi:hypothetical protein